MVNWLSEHGWAVEIAPGNVTISRKGLVGSYATVIAAYAAAKRHHANGYVEAARRG